MQTAAAPVSLAKAPLARLKGELSNLEATARVALKGTRVGALVDSLPRALEGEVDALLDRVGLVRKARGAQAAVDAAVAAADLQAQADVAATSAVVVVVDAAATGADVVEGSVDQTTGPSV